jgi:opacity protein-like surface antigen
LPDSPLQARQRLLAHAVHASSPGHSVAAGFHRGIGLFTGQIGYAWNASLLYVKGGAAVTDNRFSVLDTFTGFEFAAASTTRWGGTLGVGWEYGFAPNWSIGVEYDHLWMGDAKFVHRYRSAPCQFSQQSDQPGRGYGHPARDLPLRRLR